MGGFAVFNPLVPARPLFSIHYCICVGHVQYMFSYAANNYNISRQPTCGGRVPTLFAFAQYGHVLQLCIVCAAILPFVP